MFEGEVADAADRRRHDALSPMRLGQPVTDFCTVTIGDAIKATTADELIAAPNAELNRMAMFDTCL